MIENNEKKDYSAQIVLGFVGASLVARITYDFYRVGNRVHQLENFLDSKGIPDISQKPIVNTRSYFAISNLPSTITLNEHKSITLTIFTKQDYVVVPQSLKIKSMTKFDATKLTCDIVSHSDISQLSKMINIDFEVLGTKKGNYNLIVDLEFQINNTKTSQISTISQKIKLPLHLA
jgi:hypothetical protein